MRHAGDKPLSHRIIASTCHHDGDRARGVLGSPDRGGSPGDHHIHLEPDQLGRQVAQPLLTPLRIAVLYNEVLALNMAKLAQSLPESLPQVGG
jgi:hypothetical protein